MLGQDANAVLVDVRCPLEFDYIGHPVGAINCPWAEPPTWSPDPAFPARVLQELTARRFDKDASVLLLCRSGKRSQAAALALRAAGFPRVYNIAEGFEGDLDAARHRSSINGWRCRNLPWEQG
jgi:rhodanese-related sulfurtransferase